MLKTYVALYIFLGYFRCWVAVFVSNKQTKILPNTDASFELIAEIVAVLEASYVNCVGEVSVFPYCTPVTATLAAEDYNENNINK